MTLSSLRRIGAALVFSLVTLCWSASHAADAAAPTQGLHFGSRATASDGTTVFYDNVAGVFRALPHRNTYWIDGRFYQYEDGVWRSATAVAGPWEPIAPNLVPEAARKQHGAPETPVTTKRPSGREAVHDPRLDAYKVAGAKDVFLFDGLYYRYDSGVWLQSPKDDGPWTVASKTVLPAPLRKAVPPPKSGQTVKLPSGEVVVYDAKTRLFGVEGSPDTMFFDGTFYQRRDDKWFTSRKAASGFEEVPANKVPRPVLMKYGNPAVKGAKARSSGNKKTKAHAKAKTHAKTKTTSDDE